MTLTVYGVSLSPFVRKVRAQLAEKGIAYTHEPLNPFQAGDEFTAMNPLRRIPVLKDADAGPDFALPDSSAIVQYIERKHPETPMLPDTCADYGRALWIEEYGDTEVAIKAGGGVFRPIILAQLLGKAPDHDTARENARALGPIFDYLESAIDGREWFVGERFTLADISVASPFVNLMIAGLTPLESRWPQLNAFLDRAWSRDSFAPLVAEDRAFGSNFQKIDATAEELWG